MSDASNVRDGLADFDFLMGSWKVHHRRLRERLKGSTEWEEFEGTVTARKILGGRGNFDEGTMDRASGPVHGTSLRLYDPQSRQWSIYWADSVNAFVPIATVGEFKDGRGEFYDYEPFEGRMIFCRFIWSRITPTSCQWEQAFSADGGVTWETNWVMTFTRQA
jgi:hypothetical protein